MAVVDEGGVGDLHVSDDVPGSLGSDFDVCEAVQAHPLLGRFAVAEVDRHLVSAFRTLDDNTPPETASGCDDVSSAASMSMKAKAALGAAGYRARARFRT